MRSTDLAAGQRIVTLVNDYFEVVGPVDLDLVRVEMHQLSDALVLGTNATGRIGRVEIDTWANDGIKVSNGSVNACHDFRIDGGYVRHHEYPAGAHQDGIQVMGGARITVRNVLFEGANTQLVFVNKAGGMVTTPTDVLFVNCKLGCANPLGGPATPANINNSVRSGLRDCEVFRSPRFGRGIVIGSNAVDPVNVGNVERPVGAPGCAGEPGQPGSVVQRFRVRDAAGGEASIDVPLLVGAQNG